MKQSVVSWSRSLVSRCQSIRLSIHWSGCWDISGLWSQDQNVLERASSTASSLLSRYLVAPLPYLQYCWKCHWNFSKLDLLMSLLNHWVNDPPSKWILQVAYIYQMAIKKKIRYHHVCIHLLCTYCILNPFSLGFPLRASSETKACTTKKCCLPFWITNFIDVQSVSNRISEQTTSFIDIDCQGFSWFYGWVYTKSNWQHCSSDGVVLDGVWCEAGSPESNFTVEPTLLLLW